MDGLCSPHRNGSAVSTLDISGEVKHAPGMFQDRPGDDPASLMLSNPRRGEVR